ncbi:hypothetical protein K435DRAFT_757774 [Dendrothele bispora CBS 962.96]|uniref:Chromo domain-containing protein n=1 Tax=Dendrothele bispora (strain CBS 962.96) TaxID=1314807 RepID=A0A4S8LTX7_DENBC|nr:hypothetical protein K435DRAFT_757774 [Dendrothele bispora CBS 962.96]
MARSTSIVSDSAEKDRDASEAENEKVDDGERENDAEEEEEEEEEEYEIEAIIDHERGMFDDGKTGYLCKWKGYNSKHNSWVNEDDAGNATELIDAYWERVNAKKKPRKSDATTKKGRSSLANANAGTESPEPAPKKRGRKSGAKIDDVDDEGGKSASAKRQRREPSLKNIKTQSTELEDVVMDEPEEQIADHKYMKKFMSRKNWEDIVDTIDTVEKSNIGEGLLVYFRLNAANGGTRVRLESSVCREKFPQALLTFYESNLKWKETEVDDDMPLS